MMRSYIGENKTLKDIFNQDLVNCLPGTFYIYQIDAESVKMKMCNIFHEEIFGYTHEECMDKHPLFYIDPNYSGVIINAIAELSKTGFAKQVYANIITKQGQSIPFVFEGYKFQIGANTYFAGMGLDISDLVSAKEQIHMLEKEKSKIADEIRKKEKELLVMALQENKHKGILNTMSLQLESILANNESDNLKTELIKLKNSLKSRTKVRDNWLHFKALFINIHKDFFYNLKQKHPNLTEGEIRFCAYLKINMRSNDLCTALNISKNGLKKKRYRLKKKILLNDNVSIEEYIASI